MNTCPWDKLQHATISFCENELCAWITQPSNTWSNLAFIFAGLYLFKFCRRHSLPALQLMSVSAVFLGMGSFMFHASSRFIFEIWDLFGMFMISGFMISLNLQRLLKCGTAPIVWTYVFLLAVALFLNLLWIESGIPFFALQITAALTIEVILHLREDEIKYKFLNLTFLLFGISFTFWILDINGILCDPDNHLITGHAVWHVGNAFALITMVLFYKQFASNTKDRSTI